MTESKNETKGGWRFIDNMSLAWLAPLGIFVALAPWPMGPAPHLVEKMQMLAAGNLSQPMDIFDVLWHGWAILLTFVKAGRVAYLSKKPTDG